MRLITPRVRHTWQLPVPLTPRPIKRDQKYDHPGGALSPPGSVRHGEISENSFFRVSDKSSENSFFRGIEEIGVPATSACDPSLNQLQPHNTFFHGKHGFAGGRLETGSTSSISDLHPQRSSPQQQRSRILQEKWVCIVLQQD